MFYRALGERVPGNRLLMLVGMVDVGWTTYGRDRKGYHRAVSRHGGQLCVYGLRRYMGREMSTAITDIFINTSNMLTLIHYK